MQGASDGFTALQDRQALEQVLAGMTTMAAPQPQTRWLPAWLALLHTFHDPAFQMRDPAAAAETVSANYAGTYASAEFRLSADGAAVAAPRHALCAVAVFSVLHDQNSQEAAGKDVQPALLPTLLAALLGPAPLSQWSEPALVALLTLVRPPPLLH